jgi:hypothetical protein
MRNCTVKDAIESGDAWSHRAQFQPGKSQLWGRLNEQRGDLLHQQNGTRQAVKTRFVYVKTERL